MPDLPHETNRTRRGNHTTPSPEPSITRTRTTPRLTENTAEALHTIIRLADAWPTDTTIRETRPTNMGEGRNFTVSGSTDFGLSRLTETETSVPTRAGLERRLHQIRDTWTRILWHGHTPAANLTADAQWLIHNLAKASRLPALERDLHLICSYATQAEQACGYAPIQTGLNCPDCNTELTQPVTTEGALDILTCPACAYVNTPDGYREYARAKARLGNINHPVTQAQAAQLLNTNIKTIHQRVRDRGLQPCNLGRPRKYPLNQLA